MDRNSIIGITLIALILGVWVYMTTPTQEELAKQKRMKDSIALAESQKLKEAKKSNSSNDFSF